MQEDTGVRRREWVRVACGAGFAADRPTAALRILREVPHVQYLVLECLAERTLAARYKDALSGGTGYDPRVGEWMRVLLPSALQLGVCILTNMGAVDSEGAKAQVERAAASMGLSVRVAAVAELMPAPPPPAAAAAARAAAAEAAEGGGGRGNPGGGGECGVNEPLGHSTYLGAQPIVEALRSVAGRPDVVVTSRVADAALFLAPMVYELGWGWRDYEMLARGALAGHLLECGAQLTGGYFAHPADEHRSLSLEELLAVGLPYADVTWRGQVAVGKAKSSRGVLSEATCAQQLAYEIGDPACYITPDVALDVRHVRFTALSEHRVLVEGVHPTAGSPWPPHLLRLSASHAGWRGWGEISYGGAACAARAALADGLVRAWLEEAHPVASARVLASLVGIDSLWPRPVTPSFDDRWQAGGGVDDSEVRLHMEGVFELEEEARALCSCVEALYTNGPAGGGAIRQTCSPGLPACMHTCLPICHLTCRLRCQPAHLSELDPPPLPRSTSLPSVGSSSEVALTKSLVPREAVKWLVSLSDSTPLTSPEARGRGQARGRPPDATTASCHMPNFAKPWRDPEPPVRHSVALLPAPGTPVPLYSVAHGRAGDKGDCVNISLIPFAPEMLGQLVAVVTREWVHNLFSKLLWGTHENLASVHRFHDVRKTGHSGRSHQVVKSAMSYRESIVPLRRPESEGAAEVHIPPGHHGGEAVNIRQLSVNVYILEGVKALNIVVNSVLDGGVTLSRRLDRHGKTLSDLLLSQKVVLK
eukprot:jgi/Mesen1/4320/ME000022S03609